MQEVEATGKTIEQAVQNALLELKAAREDVDIKILSEGGFLKKAKVLVSISEDAIEKYEKKEKLKKQLEKEEKKEENDEDFAEKFVKKKIEIAKENKKESEEETIVEVKEKPVSSKKEKMKAQDFIQGVLDSLGMEGTVERKEDDHFVTYSVDGESLNDLIGYHGECMLSLSYLMSCLCEEESGKRILLDVCQYRQKRKESLTTLAKKVAGQVAKTGRYHKFEPMDASERKIIHTALQDDDRVTTMSKGDEPHRYLIVFPREYKE